MVTATRAWRARVRDCLGAVRRHSLASLTSLMSLMSLTEGKERVGSARISQEKLRDVIGLAEEITFPDVVVKMYAGKNFSRPHIATDTAVIPQGTGDAALDYIDNHGNKAEIFTEQYNEGCTRGSTEMSVRRIVQWATGKFCMGARASIR